MVERQQHPEHLVERLAVGTLDRLVNLLFARPVQIVPILFFVVSLIGALALSFPAATESGQGTPFVDAWFTAVSALCVTGLSTLDVPNHWSGMGELTILILIQLGGLGIMSASVLIVALFSRTMGFGIPAAIGVGTWNSLPSILCVQSRFPVAGSHPPSDSAS